jgi:hypothetical protein
VLSPKTREQLRLPMTFVSFAITDGGLYKFPHTHLNVVHKKMKGNNVVYGALYVLHDDNFHIRTLDSYYLCSLSTLRCNHNLDLSHRIKQEVRPITFSSIDQFSRLLYKEHEPILAEMYVANPKHPKTTQRTKHVPGLYYRQTNGLLWASYLQQLRGIQHDRTR